MNTPHQFAIAEDALPRVSRHRLTLNEQLCLFGAAKDGGAPVTAIGSWAALALALVIVPWTLVGLTIWMLA